MGRDEWVKCSQHHSLYGGIEEEILAGLADIGWGAAQVQKETIPIALSAKM